MGTAERTLLIATIHYGEWQRSPGKQALARAKQAFATWQVSELDVVQQAPLTPPERFIALASHRARQRSLEHRWRRYIERSSLAADAAAAVGQGYETFCLALSTGFRQRVDRSRQIQSIVTAKHTQAMQVARESRVQWLLVLESDATARPNSLEALAQLANWLPSDGRWFIDLAGGLDELNNRHEGYARLSEAGLTLLRRAVTNTACAYLMSAELVDYVLAYQQRHPASQQFAIDWFLNAAFMAASDNGYRVQTARAEPHVLDHGSFTGVTRSWR